MCCGSSCNGTQLLWHVQRHDTDRVTMRSKDIIGSTRFTFHTPLLSLSPVRKVTPIHDAGTIPDADIIWSSFNLTEVRIVNWYLKPGVLSIGTISSTLRVSHVASGTTTEVTSALGTTRR